MKSRFARLAVCLVPVLALFASMAPPAGSLTVGVGVFQGVANVDPGLAYYCFGGTGPGGVDVNKCPVLNAKPGNIGFTFDGSLTGGVVKVLKDKCGGANPPGACVELGTYRVQGGGRVSGKCGLSTGFGSATITQQAMIVDTKPATTASADFSFAGVGGTLILTGTYRVTGTLVGVVAAIPDTVGGSSCTNKAAKQFLLLGVLATRAPGPDVP